MRIQGEENKGIGGQRKGEVRRTEYKRGQDKRREEKRREERKDIYPPTAVT